LTVKTLYVDCNICKNLITSTTQHCFYTHNFLASDNLLPYPGTVTGYLTVLYQLYRFYKQWKRVIMAYL
jgi:hypothetical protein